MSYGGWYPRRRGILEHLESGKISLLDAAVHDVLCLWADHKTGVCMGSAEKIRALCPAEISYKSVQRSLAKLDRLAWIKRWMVKGRRGNYPILICKWFVRGLPKGISVHDTTCDLSMTWWSTNGDRTTDWRDVQFDPVHDPAFSGPRGVREVDHEVDHEVSCDQEVDLRPTRTEKKAFDDDDDGDATQKSSHPLNGNGHSNGNGKSKSPGKSKTKNIPDALRTWAQSRIISRAGRVRNRSGLILTSEDQFFANLPNEVCVFLTEQAEAYIRRRRAESDENIPYEDITRYLAAEANKHQLPYTGDLLVAVVRAAGTLQGERELPLGRPS